MAQCPFWETNSRLVNQEITYPLWNPKVYDRKIWSSHSGYYTKYSFWDVTPFGR
jgi:hypothetical protein